MVNEATPPEHPCPTPRRARAAGSACTTRGLTGFPESEQCPECEKSHPVEKKPLRIGGWLLLPAMQIVIAPVFYFPLVLNGVRVATRNAHLFIEGIIELVVCGFLFAYSIFTALNFFTRKKRTAPLMLGFYGANLFATFLAVGFDSSAGTMCWLGFIVSWMAYFFLSKRVENTFTR